MGFFDRLLGGKPSGGEGDGAVDSPEATPEQINMACAALLLEVAEADYVDDPAETEAILHALKTELNLDQAAVRALLDRARKETGGATDLFPYTHLLNQRLEREQKCAILTAMWRVAMADGVLDKYEDQLLRRVTNLLRLEHSDFIAAKQAARPKEN
jgi:uncharacterized tellurite resistance protein B-like protein